jgi:hypothetical protein
VIPRKRRCHGHIQPATKTNTAKKEGVSFVFSLFHSFTSSRFDAAPQCQKNAHLKNKKHVFTSKFCEAPPLG